VGLERLGAKALTSQDLSDDADGLVAVDRFGQVGLVQCGKVLRQLSAGTLAQGGDVTPGPGEHPIDDPVQREPPSAGDAVLRQEGQVGLLLPVLDRERQCVEGVLELIDSLGLLLNPAMQFLELGAGIRHTWPPSRWFPHLGVERAAGGLVPGSYCTRVGRYWPWVVRTARTSDPHAVHPRFVQCGRSGVTVKRAAARSNIRDVGRLDDWAKARE